MLVFARFGDQLLYAFWSVVGSTFGILGAQKVVKISSKTNGKIVIEKDRIFDPRDGGGIKDRRRESLVSRPSKPYGCPGFKPGAFWGGKRDRIGIGSSYTASRARARVCALT